ncbi:MAG: hypothetical protein HQ565_06860 [Bacteroidetes bacterium]|nr:hypothetical protein [Bacteroidota bacterium]
MKKHTIILAFVLSCFYASGQILSPELIATAGNYIIKQSYSLRGTLKETITESFLKGKDQINQELQQPYLIKTSQLPVQSQLAKHSIIISPNPTRSHFIITINAEQERRLIKMMLYDMFDVNVDETMFDSKIFKKREYILAFN